MSVALRFLTDELGFASENECREFLEVHDARDLVHEKTDSEGKSQMRVRVKEGAALFEKHRTAAFRRVDIKGQI